MLAIHLECIISADVYFFLYIAVLRRIGGSPYNCAYHICGN